MNEAAASSGARGGVESTTSTAEGSTSQSADRRSSRFEAPKRDEEAETNRKIKAKRARETRRSTQGVTQDDVKAAEATLKIASGSKVSGVNEDSSNQSVVSDSTNKQTPNTSDSQNGEEKTEEPSRRRVWQRVCTHFYYLLLHLFVICYSSVCSLNIISESKYF